MMPPPILSPDPQPIHDPRFNVPGDLSIRCMRHGSCFPPHPPIPSPHTSRSHLANHAWRTTPPFPDGTAPSPPGEEGGRATARTGDRTVRRRRRRRLRRSRLPGSARSRSRTRSRTHRRRGGGRGGGGSGAGPRGGG